jgi:hypothetical protein
MTAPVSILPKGQHLVRYAIARQGRSAAGDEGGQAIVGNVESRAEGSHRKPKGQPHALAHSPGTSLPSADTMREPVPVTCDEERSLPDARRTLTGGSKGNRNAWKHGP